MLPGPNDRCSSCGFYLDACTCEYGRHHWRPRHGGARAQRWQTRVRLYGDTIKIRSDYAH